MDILKNLQNMIDRSPAFAQRNKVALRGNGREFWKELVCQVMN